MWFPPVAFTGLQWYTSQNGVTLFQAMLCLLLLWMPWITYCRWQKRGGPVAPLFSVVAAAHWLSFGSLLFWGGRPADPIYRVPFTEETLTAIVAMAVLGILSLGIGMKVSSAFALPAPKPELKLGPVTGQYLRLVLALGAVASIISNEALGSAGIRPFFEIFRTVIPHTAFAILTRRYLLGESDRSDRIALLCYLAFRLVAGVSAGWLGSSLSLGVVGSLVYLSVRRRLPGRILLLIIPVALFLQAGKDSFRQAYWSGGKTGSTVEKVSFWVSQSFDIWEKALSGQSSGVDTGSLLNNSFQRVSLLDQAGNVYDKTPRQVPYQMGRTYSFLLITLIPRAIWPDKPSVNEANRFYQVAYGMTSTENLDSVSIAVGYLVESFINFGWAGVVIVMFFMGVLLGVFERILLSAESGVVFNALGLAIIYSLSTAEAQAAQYVGGLAQQIGLTLLVFAPVLRSRKAAEQQRQRDLRVYA